MKARKANIRVTVKFVEHPEPQRLTELWANIVVDEILRREEDAAEQ